jgi:hypothetical protein
VAQLRRMAILRAVTTFSIVGTPLLVTLSTFGLYTRLGNKLTPEVAFPSLLLFQSLIFPLTMLPMILSNAISLGVALKRLDRFMQVLPFVQLRCVPRLAGRNLSLSQPSLVSGYVVGC